MSVSDAPSDGRPNSLDTSGITELSSTLSSNSSGESFAGFADEAIVHTGIDLEFSIDYRFFVDVRILRALYIADIIDYLLTPVSRKMRIVTTD